MLIHKTFIVTGDTLTKDGKTIKTLADNIDKAVNGFLKSNPAATLIDVKHNVSMNGRQDYDVVNVLVEVKKASDVKAPELDDTGESTEEKADEKKPKGKKAK